MWLPGCALDEGHLLGAVMPVETVGFHLKPVGFFKHNPALDVPHTINTASKLASHCCGALAANGHSQRARQRAHERARQWAQQWRCSACRAA